VCERNGIVFIADEVQSGAGRTGRVWAVEHAGVQPDLLISGKSLGGGLPLAAVTGRGELMDAPPAGGLGGTFGGNPLCCAAAVPILQALQDGGFRAIADTIGARVRERLESLARRCARVGEVRGLGSMLAAELVIATDTREPDPALARRTIELALDRGLLLLSCGTYGNVLRILVPLVDDAATLDEGLAILESALLDAAAES
jgi:4-aminobutyrate aminotransferase/(S)-3-amino-2-methylpropionate transaminase